MSWLTKVLTWGSDGFRGTGTEVKTADPFYPIVDGYTNLMSHGYGRYGASVGQGYDSNVVMAPVLWVMRTFTEAKAIVQTDRANTDVWKKVQDHPLEKLIRKPNNFYNGNALWKATCISYVLNGNAYWRKIRNSIGDVIELWYTPHWLLTPRYPKDGSKFIDYWEYNHGYGKPDRILPRDLVHFRFGLDPRDNRLGLSPLHALLREVYVDDEAARFTAQLLENHGVPGMVLSPAGDAFRPNDEQLEGMKAYLASQFSGNNRGAAMVMGMPTKVESFGFDPQKLLLSALRDVSEERVCASLGIPPAVVGFGSGSESTGVGATMRELRRLAWVACLIPMQESMAEDVDFQLLEDFQSQTDRYRVTFDLSNVSTFQEEQDLTATRCATLVNAGILRVDRAQEICGLEVDDTRKIYLQPSNSMPIDEKGDPIVPATPPGAVPAVTGQDAGRGDESQQLARSVAERRNGVSNGKKPEE